MPGKGVLDNAGSLWSAPEASQEWHHDPAWQGAALRTPTRDTVPLLQVIINNLTRAEFARRWPVLVERDALRITHNRVDVDELTSGERDATRKRLGVAPVELVLMQPARVEAANKNVPGAVEFARQLARVVGRPVRYWLTDPGETGGEIGEALRQAPGRYSGVLCDLLSTIGRRLNKPVVMETEGGELPLLGYDPSVDSVVRLA